MRTFGGHDHLARSEETHDKVFPIEEGWACRYCMLPDGRRQITALFLPGDYCEPQRLQARGSVTANRCSVPLTQQDIADLVGLTPVHVNRVLGSLKAAGVVRFIGKTLHLLRPKALLRGGPVPSAA